MNTPRYVVDNCTLINFAVVDRLDLISSVLVDAAWLAAVAFETRRSARYVPTLDHAACRQWLGEPIETDLPEDNARVETIRLALGGARREPLRNLGEAQSIHAILTRVELADAVFVTDDASAADMARRNGIAVWTTVEIMRTCYDFGKIGCPDAFLLLREMSDGHDRRGVRVPRDHTAVCP